MSDTDVEANKLAYMTLLLSRLRERPSQKSSLLALQRTPQPLGREGRATKGDAGRVLPAFLPRVRFYC
jgi:hypothetical protein